MHIKWYFDFISPYSYLHLKQFGRLPPDLEIEYVPILFAGVLKHYGHKGPAEIPPRPLNFANRGTRRDMIFVRVSP